MEKIEKNWKYGKKIRKNKPNINLECKVYL